ncbi:MAG: hypothetical protein ACPGGK_06735 [Pikeienuella sp.]
MTYIDVWNEGFCLIFMQIMHENTMIDVDWITALISRAIGAARGRAARGSPAV